MSMQYRVKWYSRVKRDPFAYMHFAENNIHYFNFTRQVNWEQITISCSYLAKEGGWDLKTDVIQAEAHIE